MYYHQWEYDAQLVAKLESEQNGQANKLYEREQMDSFQLNMSQEDQIRLMLIRYEE